MPFDEYLSTPTTQIRLRWLAENVVRVTHAPSGPAPFPPERPWLEHVLLPTPGVPPEQARLRAVSVDGLLQVQTLAGESVLEEAAPPRLGAEGLGLSLRIEPGEGFYGWGEWFNAFRRERGSWRLRAQESISALQDRRTYSAFPFFLSSRGYGFLLLNSHESTWHLEPERGMMAIEMAGPPADYLLVYGPSFKQILRSYTALTGRPPLLPRWAFGLWATSYPQGHQDGVLAHVRKHRERHIPLDAVILDYHWEQRFHNFNWRRALIPDPEGMVASLKKQGVRLGLIFTPFLNANRQFPQKIGLQLLVKNIPKGMVLDDDRALPEYREARAKGYLAHPKARWWFGQGGMLDFSNPEASQWWNAMLRPLYDQGVAFFKNDDGEYLPDDAHSALGMEAREYHNLYGFFYGRAIYEGMQALDDRRPLIYARSVWAGSQRYPALFLGDQKPSFECIRRTLRAGLNLGLAGFAYWTADVFGLDGKTTPETHMRYAQWALLVPVARYFWRPPEIDDTRFPWSHGAQVEANFRTYSELRYRLLLYYVSLAWEAYQSGLPILRPLVLEFQDDPRLAGVYDQVMLGERLMLCPVVQAGAVERRVLLPAGVWHDFWSGQSWDGPGEIELPAPLERLPILVRGGTILPMGPALEHIPDDHRLDTLQLHCWPPYPASCVIYDDDGRTCAYQRGAFSTTQIAVEEVEDGLEVRIAPAQGGFAEQAAVRQVEIVLHRSPAPQQVTVEGEPALQWDYAPGTGQVSVSLDCPVDQERLVKIIVA